MTATAPRTPRALARDVARLLVGKGKTDEAVAVLAAWAAAGASDEEAQALLAEALRIDPASKLAKMAFERMEGVPGDHAALEKAIARYTADALELIEKAHKRPSFRRAQVGYNNNVKYQGRDYHIQTEDSGLDRPHVITHLFADGGRVIKSHKRTYEHAVGRPDVADLVRQLMKGQHMEMAIALREGRFDDVIAGRAAGGMVVLTDPPSVRVRRGAGEAAARAKVVPTPPPARAIVHVRFHVMRSLWGGPETFEPPGEELVVGRAGDVALEGERFCAPREAVVRWQEGKAVLQGDEAGSGLFLRIREPVILEWGDEFMIGDQMLRLGRNPTPDDEPGPGPTYFYSSPRWVSSFRLVQIWEGGQPGAVLVARGGVAQIGRAWGDIVFADDPLIDDAHCVIEEQAGSMVLSDLGSRTGTFVRVTRERVLENGDEIAVGRTRLRLEMVR